MPGAPSRRPAAAPRPRTASRSSPRARPRAAGRKARQEPPHRLAVRRRHPPARDLAHLGIDPRRGDVRPMLIQAHHDRHASAPRVEHHAQAASSQTQHYRGSRSALRIRMNRPRGCYPRAPSTYVVRHGGPATFRRTANALLLMPSLSGGSGPVETDAAYRALSSALCAAKAARAGNVIGGLDHHLAPCWWRLVGRCQWERRICFVAAASIRRKRLGGC